MKKGKKYTEAAKLVDKTVQYEIEDAVSLVKKTAVAKFDETVEAHIRLGVDGRHADQQVRGAVVLPHGTGKTVRVLVFAKGPKVDEAEAAGADIIVLCSSDDEYAEYAPAAYELIKAHGNKQIFVVAGAPACMEDLKAAGIENFIHVRVNVLDELRKYSAQLLK